MTDYVPIGCDQHAVLELLAMRRARVSLDVRDAHGATLVRDGTVVDVMTRDGAEFLGLETPTGRVDLRLDRLSRIRDLDGDVVWRQESDSCN